MGKAMNPINGGDGVLGRIATGVNDFAGLLLGKSVNVSKGESREAYLNVYRNRIAAYEKAGASETKINKLKNKLSEAEKRTGNVTLRGQSLAIYNMMKGSKVNEGFIDADKQSDYMHSLAIGGATVLGGGVAATGIAHSFFGDDN